MTAFFLSINKLTHKKNHLSVVFFYTSRIIGAEFINISFAKIHVVATPTYSANPF